MADPTLAGGLDPSSLDPEDAKIVTLARSARARTGSKQGAAVRDTDGRTYSACTVSLSSLRLTALQAAVAAAVSAGARGLEAAAVVGADPAALRGGTFDDPGLGAVSDVTSGAAVFVTGNDVEVVHKVSGP